MAFPIYYEGKILFRDGQPAFSTDCCCPVCIGCRYYYYSFAIVGDVDWRAGPAPEPDDTVNYYAGQRSTSVDDPIFTAYNTHLWLWEACEYVGNEAPYTSLFTAVEAFHAANMASVGITGEALDFGLAAPFNFHGDDNFWIDSMRSQYLDSPPGYTVDELINFEPPNWGKCI